LLRTESTEELSDNVYKAFISSLKASPAYAPAFTSLGLYYRSLSDPDWERSSKCFQKAFELDPSQEVAAKYLAEEFAELSEWSLVEVIARRVVEGNKGKAGMGGKAAARLAWAWKAIGGAELVSPLSLLPLPFKSQTERNHIIV
jgi:superkiller protein 3